MAPSDEIVKVQLPLSGNADANECLVYDRQRERSSVQRLPWRVLNALGKDVKGHFRAQRQEDGRTWAVFERVADQDW